jgi:MFS transporter, FHS family, L-fucose permease
MNSKAAIRACKLSVFLFSLCTTLLAPLILSIGAEFGLRLQDSGMMFLAFYAGNFTACAFCGKLLSRFGKTRVLGISLFVMSILCGLIAAAPYFFIVCIVLFFLGLTTLVIQVAGTTIPSQLSSDNAASAMSGVQAFCALGSGGGLLWSGALLTLGFSWRASYLCFAVVSLFAAVLFSRVSFPELPREASGGLREISSILRNRSFHPTFLCLLLYSGAETSVCSWLVTYLTRDLSFSSLSASAVTGTIWVSLFIGRLTCSRLARTIKVRSILMVLIPGSALCTMVIPHLSGVSIWIAAALLGLLLSGIWPLVGSRLIDDPSYDSGTTLSMAFLFSFFSSTMTPYLIGVVAGHAGIPAAITTDGGIFILLFLVFFLSRLGIK